MTWKKMSTIIDDVESYTRVSSYEILAPEMKGLVPGLIL